MVLVEELELVGGLVVLVLLDEVLVDEDELDELEEDDELDDDELAGAEVPGAVLGVVSLTMGLVSNDDDPASAPDGLGNDGQLEAPALALVMKCCHTMVGNVPPETDMPCTLVMYLVSGPG